MASSVRILGLFVLVLCAPMFLTNEDNNVCRKMFSYSTCICGNGKDVLVPFRTCQKRRELTGEKYCDFCSDLETREKLCGLFRNCQTCTHGLKSCSSCPPGMLGRFCIRDAERRKSNLIEEDYPIRVNISLRGKRSDNNEVLHRYIRDKKTCNIPSGITTADFDCTVWPSHLQCVQMCIFGYTLPEGLTHPFTCDFKEDKWKPHEMSDCKPYIDCNLRLESPGEMTCTHGELNKGTECEIMCFKSKEHEAVASQKYQCDNTGKWVPDLPFCAVNAGSD